MTTTHSDIMQGLQEQFAPLFEESTDGVYLWLDETNAICNEKLARMFGYTVAEWQSAVPFLESFVAEDDRKIFSMNYHNCVARLAHPVTFRFRGLRKDGTTFAAETDMIPLVYQGHPVAYHFVRQVGE